MKLKTILIFIILLITSFIPVCATNDTDNDGLSDNWELQYFGTLMFTGSDDPDLDGLTNLQEYQLDLNPTNPDEDGDGLLDGWEVTSFGHFEYCDTDDPDGDGVINRVEQQFRTNPSVVDSDSDGLTDYEEIYFYYTNPTYYDSDYDELTDYDEIHLYATNPLNMDSDGDGWNDAFELSQGMDPWQKDPLSYSFNYNGTSRIRTQDGVVVIDELDGQLTVLPWIEFNSPTATISGRTPNCFEIAKKALYSYAQAGINRVGIVGKGTGTVGTTGWLDDQNLALEGYQNQYIDELETEAAIHGTQLVWGIKLTHVISNATDLISPYHEPFENLKNLIIQITTYTDTTDFFIEAEGPFYTFAEMFKKGELSLDDQRWENFRTKFSTLFIPNVRYHFWQPALRFDESSGEFYPQPDCSQGCVDADNAYSYVMGKAFYELDQALGDNFRSLLGAGGSSYFVAYRNPTIPYTQNALDFLTGIQRLGFTNYGQMNYVTVGFFDRLQSSRVSRSYGPAETVATLSEVFGRDIDNTNFSQIPLDTLILYPGGTRFDLYAQFLDLYVNRGIHFTLIPSDGNVNDYRNSLVFEGDLWSAVISVNRPGENYTFDFEYYGTCEPGYEGCEPYQGCMLDPYSVQTLSNTSAALSWTPGYNRGGTNTLRHWFTVRIQGEGLNITQPFFVLVKNFGMTRIDLDNKIYQIWATNPYADSDGDGYSNYDDPDPFDPTVVPSDADSDFLSDEIDCDFQFVTIDSNRNIVIDGTPFFPVGYSAIYYNVMDQYDFKQYINAFSGATDFLYDYIDNPATNNAVKLFSASPLSAVDTNDDGEPDTLELRHLADYGHSRNIIGWQVYHEPNSQAVFNSSSGLWEYLSLYGNVPLYSEMIRQNDPHQRLVYIVPGIDGAAGQYLADHAQYVDIAGVQAGYRVPMLDVATGGVRVSQAAANMGDKPIIVYLRIGGYQPNRLRYYHREPTLEEIRIQAYNAIIHGAKGVFLWPFSKGGEWQPGELSATVYNLMDSPKQLHNMETFTADLLAHQHIFVSPVATDVSVISSNNNIKTQVFEAAENGKTVYYLLCANVAEETSPYFGYTSGSQNLHINAHLLTSADAHLTDGGVFPPLGTSRNVTITTNKLHIGEIKLNREFQNHTVTHLYLDFVTIPQDGCSFDYAIYSDGDPHYVNPNDNYDAHFDINRDQSPDTKLLQDTAVVTSTGVNIIELPEPLELQHTRYYYVVIKMHNEGVIIKGTDIRTGPLSKTGNLDFLELDSQAPILRQGTTVETTLTFTNLTGVYSVKKDLLDKEFRTIESESIQEIFGPYAVHIYKFPDDEDIDEQLSPPPGSQGNGSAEGGFPPSDNPNDTGGNQTVYDPMLNETENMQNSSIVLNEQGTEANFLPLLNHETEGGEKTNNMNQQSSFFDLIFIHITVIFSLGVFVLICIVVVSFYLLRRKNNEYLPEKVIKIQALLQHAQENRKNKAIAQQYYEAAKDQLLTNCNCINRRFFIKLRKKLLETYAMLL